MKTVIMAQTNLGFQEFFLPGIHNSDYRIRLNRESLGLAQDLVIKLEILDNEWRIVEDRDYLVERSDGKSGLLLEDEAVFRICPAAGGAAVSLLVVFWKQCRISCRKYDLSGISEVSVGSAAGNTLRYQFHAYISQRHALLVRTGGGWSLYDYGKNGTFVNGVRVSGSRALQFGDCITMFGLRLIFLGDVLALSAVGGELEADAGRLPEKEFPRAQAKKEPKQRRKEKRYYKSAPRTVEPLFEGEIEIENPPAKRNVKKRPVFLTIGPAFTMAIPMLLGCSVSVIAAKSRGSVGGAFMYTGLITALTSAVFGAVWAFSNLKYAGKEEAEEEELRYNAYGQYLIDMAEQVREKYEDNRRILHTAYVSGQECCRISARAGDLWNRNFSQPDFLFLRLGCADLPFPGTVRVSKQKFALLKDDLMEKPMQLKKNFETMYQVPVCLDLLKQRLVGVIGGETKEGGRQVLENAAAQIAAHNSYADVKMVFIYDGEKEGQRWSFAKWLPHVWSEDKKIRFVADNKAELGDLCFALGSVLRERAQEKESAMGKSAFTVPHYVLFLIDPEMLEGELIRRYVTQPDVRYGISVLWLAKRYEELPNSCEQIVCNDGRSFGIYNVKEGMSRFTQVSFDRMAGGTLEAFARGLTGIEVEDAQKGSGIPEELDFLSLYRADCVEELKAGQRWKKNRVCESMRVPIGRRENEQDCFLDIHEKYHGPHGLVAGTTGSGKSETLQTYILSLAVNFGPEDVSFFIIDFKGGGMANLFCGLPHLAGQISNLSGGQVRRAMVSIKSENRRRQRIFNEHGVNNINSYSRLYKNGEASEPVPHLLIVIDEFAELKREEPEFMKELISVAQVGRSLGVHLILATQKPEGTVDDNIWSNTKFRLCLRVQDRKDSNGMLHRPDAAYLTQAGRCYLQVGNDEIFELFQSGYSGAVYDPQQGGGQEAAQMISLTGRSLLEGRKSWQRRLKRAAGQQEKTQLEAVIEYLCRTAEESRCILPRRLWLPPLPRILFGKQLEGFGKMQERRTGAAFSLKAPVGLYDDPVNQEQGGVWLDFAKNGHHGICGGVASGKSTFLQTAVFSFLTRYTPDQVQFYLLDFGNRMLSCLEKAPHVGGAVYDGEEEKAGLFFSLLSRMMAERKALFQGGSYEQYARADRKPVPAVVVVVDNYAGFREKTQDKYGDALLRLSREGVGYGIYLLISGAGFGMAEIPGRIADNLKTVWALEMGDKFKYAEVLRCTRAETLPEGNVRGRGLAGIKGEILEFQTALAAEAEDDFARSRKLEEACRQMALSWTGKSAVPIPEIPRNPEFGSFLKLPEVRGLGENRRYLPIGFRKEDATIYAVDLSRTYFWLISGKSGSGKTNLLKGMLFAAAQKDAELAVIEQGKSELLAAAQNCRAEYVSTHQEIFDFFAGLRAEFVRRNKKKQRLISEGTEGEALWERMQEEKPVFVFVADWAALIRDIYQKLPDGASMSGGMENIAEKGSLHNIYFIGAVRSEEEPSLLTQKAFRLFTEHASGIHLGGNITAQRIFSFTNIPFAQQSRAVRPGSGLAPSAADASRAEEVILPVARGNRP